MTTRDLEGKARLSWLSTLTLECKKTDPKAPEDSLPRVSAEDIFGLKKLEDPQVRCILLPACYLASNPGTHIDEIWPD